MFDTEQEPQETTDDKQQSTELEAPAAEREEEPDAALSQTRAALSEESESETESQSETIKTDYKDIAPNEFIAPDKASASLAAIIIGNAEGTRTPKGGTTWAYGQHNDPGNSKINRGSFSLQGATNLTPEKADREQQRRMQAKLPAYTAACKAAGISPSNAVALTSYFDMYNIKPALADKFGAMLGDLASKGLTLEAAIEVRVAASQRTQSRARWSGWERVARNRLKKDSSKITDAEFWRVVRAVHAERTYKMRDAMVALGLKQRGTTQRTKPDSQTNTQTQTSTQTDAQRETKPDPQTTQEPDGKTDGGGTVTVTVGELRPIRPGHIISDSVGKGGANHPADVGTVQLALAAHGHSPGPHDMKIGPLTIGAIQDFQRSFLRRPDGLVEVGKKTEAQLMKGGNQTQTQTQTDADKDDKDTDAKPDQDTDSNTPDPLSQTTTGNSDSDSNTDSDSDSDSKSTTTTPISDGGLRELMAKPRLDTAEIARARALIAKEPKDQRPQLYRDLQGKVRYANQLDNETTEGGKRIGYKMCNLTSLAMCLQYLGVPNPYPDMQYEDALEKVRIKKGFKARTLMAEGWGAVARALGATVKTLAGDGTFKRAWWEKHVGGALSAGQGVMLSLGGPKSHIVRVQAVTEGGLLVDDPNGQAKLNAGVGHVWEKRNKATSEGKAGEDFTWPWSQVEPHLFHWVAAISR